jgi:hypothetical protein
MKLEIAVMFSRFFSHGSCLMWGVDVLAVVVAMVHHAGF